MMDSGVSRKRGSASHVPCGTDGRRSLRDAWHQSGIRSLRACYVAPYVLPHGAELVVERPAAEDGYRLQLQAMERVWSSLESLMNAVGLVGADGQVTVNVDQCKVAFERFPASPTTSSGDR